MSDRSAEPVAAFFASSAKLEWSIVIQSFTNHSAVSSSSKNSEQQARINSSLVRLVACAINASVARARRQDLWCRARRHMFWRRGTGHVNVT